MILEKFTYKSNNYIIKLSLIEGKYFITAHFQNGGYATGVERCIDNVMALSPEEIIKKPLLKILVEESKLDITSGLWDSLVETNDIN